MIAALAGRRIDARGTASPRFPATRVDHVEDAIRRRLVSDAVSILVCAAACGADLLALAAAEKLEIRRRIILPFSIERFRQGSVADCSGPYPWAETYDRIIEEVERKNDLLLLNLDPLDQDAYEKANIAILDEVQCIAAQNSDKVEALVVWDERSQREGDITRHFALEAHRRMAVKSIPILETTQPL